MAGEARNVSAVFYENDPTHISNHDVIFMCSKVDRYLEEMNRSQSTGLSGIIQWDQQRINAYLDALDVALAHVRAIPIVDTPETHPHMYVVEPGPEIVNVNSEEINHLCNMFLTLRNEILHSQSAKAGSNVIEHDARRWTDLVQKCRLFMADYVATQTPEDMPESSPEEPNTRHGKKNN